MTGASLVGSDLSKALGLATFVAPVLAVREPVTGVKVLEHQLVVVETLPTAQERTLPPFLRRHLLAGIPFNGGPDDKLVESTVIVWSVAASDQAGTFSK